MNPLHFSAFPQWLLDPGSNIRTFTAHTTHPSVIIACSILVLQPFHNDIPHWEAIDSARLTLALLTSMAMSVFIFYHTRCFRRLTMRLPFPPLIERKEALRTYNHIFLLEIILYLVTCF
ncbi:Uncharacterized protein TCM_019263 [Theobroma cacao]|uniref:Uncharacterized protein n=1 Tax=Theobroma cacao TaxID=3641 RepID=A0A061EGJ9_THECC|nr:Uncharacterized protein TCM_019263 [Theobroma cacao]